MLVRYYELDDETHNICPCRTLLHTTAVLFYRRARCNFDEPSRRAQCDTNARLRRDLRTIKSRRGWIRGVSLATLAALPATPTTAG